jgi:hypothetical protein
LGAGGYAMLTDNDYLSIDAELMSDCGYLHGFASDLRDGVGTLPQNQARGGLYVGNARIQFWIAMAGAMAATIVDNDVLIERRTLGPSEHCRDCLDYYDSGWQLEGTLPEPGQSSQCRQNCRCRKIYTTVPHTELGDWIGTKRNASNSR